MIKIDDLSYEINGKNLLKDIGIEIEKEEIVGIIGPNGSGKTTLLKHIYGDLKSKGKILFYEKYLEEYSNRELAQKMAILIQENSLNRLEMTISDFCLMGRYSYKKVFEEYNEEDWKVVEKYLKKLGLFEMRKRKVKELSGGEKQRLLIARAFVQETEYIILDEPTNHLDIKYGIELMEILKKCKKTIVVTLHDLNLAMRYCDKILIIKDGRVVTFGETMEVMREDILKEVFGIEFKIVEIDDKKIIYY